MNTQKLILSTLTLSIIFFPLINLPSFASSASKTQDSEQTEDSKPHRGQSRKAVKEKDKDDYVPPNNGMPGTNHGSGTRINK